MHHYDFIGDIHGHVYPLEQLLQKMGYEKVNGVYAHPERKVFFVGDFIDRGPNIRETLSLVRSMYEAGHAKAVMGNHEYNAITFHQTEYEGGHLRPHNIKNILQHAKTLEAFKNNQEEYDDYIAWFQTLPIWHEEETFRVVHACWDNHSFQTLKTITPNALLSDAVLRESVKKQSQIHLALEIVLKGYELPMPTGMFFMDKDGFFRNEIRIKWWKNPSEITFKEYSVVDVPNLPESKIPNDKQNQIPYYSPVEKPVFFGHYWLKGIPQLITSNVCCLDYSVAKGGYLTAYRFNGEKVLSASNLWYTKAGDE